MHEAHWCMFSRAATREEVGRVEIIPGWESQPGTKIGMDSLAG